MRTTWCVTLYVTWGSNEKSGNFADVICVGSLAPLLGGGRREDGYGAEVARLLQERHVPPQIHRLVPVGRADGAQLQEEEDGFLVKKFEQEGNGPIDLRRQGQ